MRSLVAALAVLGACHRGVEAEPTKPPAKEPVCIIDNRILGPDEAVSTWPSPAEIDEHVSGTYAGSVAWANEPGRSSDVVVQLEVRVGKIRVSERTHNPKAVLDEGNRTGCTSYLTIFIDVDLTIEGEAVEFESGGVIGYGQHSVTILSSLPRPFVQRVFGSNEDIRFSLSARIDQPTQTVPGGFSHRGSAWAPEGVFSLQKQW